MAGKSRWPSEEEWRKYGVDKGYDKRNPKSLRESDDKDERSWYYRGQNQRWDNRFDFERLRKKIPQNEEEWRKYGFEREYDERNVTSFQKSKNKEERRWYRKGYREGWDKRFGFNKIVVRWKNEKEWRKYGFDNGFDERNPHSLQKSEDEDERGWYIKGYKKGWRKRFEFKMKNRVPWQNEEEWRKYGFDNGFDERNSSSLSQSEDNEERSWYRKGYREGWTKGFDFEIIRSQHIKNSQQLINFLKQDTTARNLAVAATMLNGEAYDIEQMMIDMYDSKFDNQGNLHKLLEANAREIYDLIEEGITNLGEYIGEYALGDRSIVPVLLGEAVMSLPENKVNASLEERLVRILRNQYSPRFNSNPYETLSEIEKRVSESEGKMKEIYGGLERYYGEVLELGEEI